MAEFPPPFFIVGAGRSGTTLVRAALAAHSRIAVPPETHYFKFIHRHGAATAEAPADFERFWNALCDTRHFQDLGVDPGRILDLVEASGERTFKSVFEAMLAAYAEREGKSRTGEKTPGHALFLDRIFDWFPQARIIAVRRDPRAVVASHLESPWVTQQLRARGPRAPLLPRLRLFHVTERARIWQEIYGSCLARAEEDPRFRLVSYEDLVSHPERELRALAEFVGVEFEPGMITGRTKVPGAAASDRIRGDDWRTWIGEHERRSAAPISRDGIEKWRGKLTPREVNVVEAICRPQMLRFGYRPDRPMVRSLASALAGAAVTNTARIEERVLRSFDHLRQARSR